MQLTDFDFNLPSDLIAQYPLERRTDSKLMFIDRSDSSIHHLNFKDFPSLLNEKELLVFNDTRVVLARIYAKKDTGGNVEMLFERVISDTQFLAHLKANKALKLGAKLVFNDFVCKGAPYVSSASIIGRDGDLFILELRNNISIFDIMEQIGHVPLPHYMSRSDEKMDHTRYQTVFAKNIGAVAAPTASLHFDESLLNEITAKGVETAFVTLHVGSGTFKPVRTDNIKEHKMHKEMVSVPLDVVEKVLEAKRSGKSVVAIGTTVVRSLETASKEGEIKPFSGDTDIFIYPGYKFKCVDALLTNFHLPKSTLLMLVSAFAGRELIMKAYAEAIKHNYRFFSYGDAMFIR